MLNALDWSLIRQATESVQAAGLVINQRFAHLLRPTGQANTLLARPQASYEDEEALALGMLFLATANMATQYARRRGVLGIKLVGGNNGNPSGGGGGEGGPGSGEAPGDGDNGSQDGPGSA